LQRIKKHICRGIVREQEENLICVGCCPPKPLSLASLVNLRTRFLLRGVVLSHPEIFEFQDVIKIKNKTTIFL